MGCWQKLAEIWTGTVHDPMNLLDNAIVGSVFVIIEQTSARRRPQRFFYSIGNTELCLNAKAMIPIEQKALRGIALRQNGMMSLKRLAAGGESCRAGFYFICPDF